MHTTISPLENSQCCNSLVPPTIASRSTLCDDTAVASSMSFASSRSIVNNSKRRLPFSVLQVNEKQAKLSGNAVSSTSKLHLSTARTSTACSLTSKSDDYDDEKGAFTYTCGAVLRKIRGIHMCEICELHLCGTRVVDDEGKLFMYNKAYNSNFGGLIVPSAAFVNYLRKADKVFVDIFNVSGHKAGILKSCLVEFQLSGLSLPSPCRQYPDNSCVKYFFKTRLHYTLKFINRNLPSQPKQNRKLIKIQSL
jgi:hypothetical protein